MKQNYPGGRTAAQWKAMSVADRNMVITKIQSEIIRLWTRCKKKRCRRERSCTGMSFTCFHTYRAGLPMAEQRRIEKKCAWLDPFTP